MRRVPRPSLVTTTLPALAALVGACHPDPPRFAPNPPPPHPEPPPARDAGGPVSLEPVLVEPDDHRHIRMAGAPRRVTDLPPPRPAPPPRAPSPAPSPRAAAPMAPAPMAPTPAALSPGLYLVHEHPPGTPCRPVSETELQQALQRGGA